MNDSTLFVAGISGIPMLLSSPFWVIYIIAIDSDGSGNFATYENTIAKMSPYDTFGYVLEGYLITWFHLAIG
jgi:hypothetical protein